MKIYKTITGRTITVVSSNKKNRTYIIKTDVAKYITNKMSKLDFENAKFWTGDDWNQYLKSDEYSKIN